MIAALALATAGLAALAAAPPLAGQGDLRVEAGLLTWDVTTDRFELAEGVHITRGELSLRARSARYDPATGEVWAEGGVLLTEPARAVSAEALHLVLGGPYEAEGVVAWLKEAPAELAGATSAAEAGARGRNRVALRGARLRGQGSRLFVEDARLTLCDCPSGGAPSWEITARRADVVPGERAVLTWPVLRVTPRLLLVDRPVPVLVLPWLYVPLGDRQTGLLVPEVGSSGASGFTLAQPVFVTLGRSADVTLVPLYAFGPAREKVAEGAAAVRGPGLRAEGRWAPAEGAAGRLEVSWLQDLDREVDVATGASGHGARVALVGEHSQRLSARTRAEARIGLFGDPLYTRDFDADLLAKGALYRRSGALLSGRGRDLALEVSAAWLEPLGPDGRHAGRDFGVFGSGVGALHRWPSAAVALAPRRLLGPLALSGRAGLSRFAEVGRDADAPLSRSATRADARLELSAPLLLGRALALEPFAHGAALAWALEADGTDRADERLAATGLVGLRLGTEVSRTFGSHRHAIAPRLEWRLGAAPRGDLPDRTYDLWEPLRGGLSGARPGAFHQLRAAVGTRLSAGGRDLVRLEVGQDLDLRRGQAGETFASAAALHGPFAAETSARFLAFGERPEPAPAPRRPSGLDELTELRASLALVHPRGHALRAGLLSLGPGGSGLLAAGVDPLFDLRPAAGREAAQATLSARVALGGTTLGYDALVPGRPSFSICNASRPVGALQVQQHVGSFEWDSPCRCFRARAVVRLDDCGTVSYAATLDLSRLGGAAR